METPSVIVYALPGSQFVFKALAALQSRKVPHYVTMVPLKREARQEALPSDDSVLVPQMKVVQSEDDDMKNEPAIVIDSESILHWIDENIENAGLYPNDKAKELSERASDHTLAAMVWYYNNIDPKGYKQSLQPSISKALFPWFVPSFLGNVLVDQFMKSVAAGKRKEILKAMPDIEDSTLDNEPVMRQKMIAELEYFQTQLQSTPDQNYLVPDTDRPTAADFSVYAQVMRLLGGGASDIEVNACCPELREESSLQRLWEWYDLMKSDNYVEFKGKRAPQSMLWQ